MAVFSNIGDLFRLDGKVALITGGSRGLGLHTATGFLLSGASLVIITARNASGSEGLDMAVEKLKVLSSGSEKVKGRVIAIPADLSTYSEIVRLKDTLANQHSINHIDILVANAAATWGGPFETTPDWSSGKILDLNVRSVFGLVQVFQSMLEKAATERDPSRVIIVSSTAGRTVPHVKENGTIMYAASKAAATHLGKNLAIELGPKNITTNVVSPGFFPSKLANGLIEKLGGNHKLREENPRRRLGEPEDIAGVMVYLSSMAASYVNGVEIVVDGGRHLGTAHLNTPKL